MTVFIGTSGWQYGQWRGRFYPERIPQAGWLEHYAAHFRTVEVNNTFYRLPSSETFVRWEARTPEDFTMALKASRFLTHVRRLREPAEPVKLFLDRAANLGRKLGPVLLQLPPNLRADLPALDDTLAQFPPEVRVAVEFRHPSWFTDDVRDVTASRGAALCLVDRESRRVGPVWRTAGWTYLRLHQGAAAPQPCYGRAALESWARLLAEEWGPRAEAYVYFNNDGRACAVRDAGLFAAAARRAGLEPTPVPDPGTIRVA